jgi:hypothetical protein
MGLFSAKLDQLETKLQTLIEGRLARLIPVQHSKEALVQRLVSAMKEGVRQEESDFPIAPDIYYLMINPEGAKGLIENPPFFQGLANIIQEAGADAGLRFINPPVVNISPNQDIEPDQIDIMARISEGTVSETISMTPPPRKTENNNLPSNAFLIVNGVRIFSLDKTVIDIGRRSDNELTIDDPRVSRHHAQLRAVRGKYILSDLGSTGGTLVNGKRIKQCVLNPRDVISLAGVPLVYGQDETDILGETQKFEIQPPHDDDRPTKDHPV